MSWLLSPFRSVARRPSRDPEFAFPPSPYLADAEEEEDNDEQDASLVRPVNGDPQLDTKSPLTPRYFIKFVEARRLPPFVAAYPARVRQNYQNPDDLQKSRLSLLSSRSCANIQ